MSERVGTIRLWPRIDVSRGKPLAATEACATLSAPYTAQKPVLDPRESADTQ
ncbi:hypothetical protein RCDURKIN_40 [Rhodobacter phage RcDurkin]|nr:hypothetical protein RCDURKIN_40 [Rhodobacter phage RcDurkin]QXN72510.1 hypothetical protein RCTIPTONUS_40 [Rhodobacter phage RcTiptonus]UUV43784.1 hypothetical protein RCKICKAPOO_43 [Rhodobacter phage RcKickapoo]